MLPREPFIDLLAITASAPARDHRSAAMRLMARERIARFDIGDRNFNGRGERDFAYQHLSDGQQGGPRVAGQYLWYADRGGMASVPQEPGPRATYNAELAALLPEAAALRTSAIANMGEPAFTAARAPYVAHFAAWDFAFRSDVGRYQVLGTADPGVSYPLRTTRRPAAGYSEIHSLESSPEITISAPGIHHVLFRDDNARSDGTANPTELRVVLTVDGVEAAAFTALRGSSDPADLVRFGRHTVDITVPANAVLTVRNGSAHTQWFGGSIRLWRDP